MGILERCVINVVVFVIIVYCLCVVIWLSHVLTEMTMLELYKFERAICVYVEEAIVSVCNVRAKIVCIKCMFRCMYRIGLND